MRFRCRPLIAAGVFLAISLTLLGDRRSATGPDEWGGKKSPEVGSESPSELRIATFNIHGCRGLDSRRDAPRIAECLEGLDIVGLNEVHGWLWNEPPDQAAHLALLCGVSRSDYVFAPAETRWFGAKRFGNALLSSQPLLSWRRIPLPRHYDHSYRNMLLAEVAWKPETLAVLVAHVTRSEERDREIQLEAVLDMFVSLDPPAVLLADLNTPPDDPQMVEFLNESDAIDAIKQGGEPGADRVDWIMVRGLECLKSERVDTEASDHPLFTARLRRAKSTNRLIESARIGVSIDKE